MVSILLAAAFTFSATATGVEKGTPVEFAFAAKNSDRDYETMFLLDEPVSNFCARIEKAGIPVGRPADPARCRLWPTGCRVKFSPNLSEFISGKMPEGLAPEDPIYTGGTRSTSGIVEAATNMPGAVFSIYSLAQAPIVHNGIFDQGAVYGAFTAGKTLKKGTRLQFSITWDETSMPKPLRLVAKPGNAAQLIRKLQDESSASELDVLVEFDGSLTVREATAVASALSTVDSKRVKINGVANIFYRSFLPLVKWLDRKERLVQPFEFTLGKPDKLIYIDEDWSGPGDDPVLTPKEINIGDACKYPKTTTCFIFADPDMTVTRVVAAMKQLSKSYVNTWYVYSKP